MRAIRMTALTGLALLGASIATAAQAGQTNVSLTGKTNDNSNDLQLNNLLPKAGGTITINGIGFALNGTTGDPFNFVHLDSDTTSVSFAVSIPNVSTIYTLLNSFYGVAPNTIATITFGDLAGDSFSYNYTEGTNVRDYFDNVYNNSAPSVFGTAVYAQGNGGFQNQDNFDAQQIVLPAAFALSTLTSITFAAGPDVGPNAGYINGQGVLFGITAVSRDVTAPVPEPATWALMLTGFGLAGGALRRTRGRRAAVALG